MAPLRFGESHQAGDSVSAINAPLQVTSKAAHLCIDIRPALAYNPAVSIPSRQKTLMTGSRRNITILVITKVVVMLGFGIVIPILPFYVRSLGASGSTLGALMATYGVM
jgi:hypothetical protein